MNAVPIQFDWPRILGRESHQLKAYLESWGDAHPYWRPLVALTLDQPLTSYGEILASNAAHNAALVRTLVGLSEIVGAAPPSFLVVKGVLWLLTLYPSFGVRPLADVDLLVRSESLPVVQGALRRLGFTPVTPRGAGTATPMWSSTCDDTGTRQIIELHLRPGHGHPPYFSRLQVQALWEKPFEVNYKGTRFYRPSLEHLLLWQCLHVHNRLTSDPTHAIWPATLCDLCLFLRRYESEIDRDRWVRICQEWNLVLPAAFSLSLACTLQPLPIAQRIVEELAQIPIPEPDRRLFRRFTSGSFRARLAMRYMGMLREAGGVRERVTLLFRLLFPPREFVKARYHASDPRGMIRAYGQRVLRGIALLWTWLRRSP